MTQPTTSYLPTHASWRSLALLLLLASLLAWFALRTPQPLGKGSDLAHFAAGRAIEDIRVMAAVPHPVGSAANQQVRDQLLARLRTLGFQPTIQRVEAAPAWGRWSKRATAHTVENVIAVLPGAMPKLPALLLMSHYDSVPKSPGAADDMAGVSSMLEIARLLQRQGTPARDVIFLFTDGEEAGLIGARAFAEHNPLIDHVGFVINLESRGGGGRAIMFETGAENGEGVRLLARHALWPSTNSLAAYIYKVLPNDTDFTVTRHRGIAGLNFAFIGRPELYHTPEATPERVEPGAIQSMGEQAWAVVQEIGYVPNFRLKSADLAWFDLFGRAVVLYSYTLGWLPILGSLICWVLIYRRLQPDHRAADIRSGMARSFLALLIAIIALVILGLIGGNYRHALRVSNFTTLASSIILLGAALIAWNWRRSGAPSPARSLGASAVALIIALLLQVVAPATAPVASWAALGATLILASSLWPYPGLALVLGGISLGFLFENWYLFMVGVGVTLPPAVAILLPLEIAVLAPWLQFVQTRRAPQMGVLCLIMGWAVAVVARIAF